MAKDKKELDDDLLTGGKTLSSDADNKKAEKKKQAAAKKAEKNAAKLAAKKEKLLKEIEAAKAAVAAESDTEKKEKEQQKLKALQSQLAALGSSYHAVGCEQCQGSGYIGRLGLYEFIELDAGLIGLLYDGASELAMQAYLGERRQSLVAMASECLARGETSLAEVLRAVQG